MIYYDITDIINHSKFSTKVSGIQRVVLEGMKGLSGEYSIFFISPLTERMYLISGLESVDIDDLSIFKNMWVYADFNRNISNDEIQIYFNRVASKRRKYRASGLLFSILKNIPLISSVVKNVIKKKVINRISSESYSVKIVEFTHFKENSSLALFGGVWNFQGTYEHLLIEKALGIKKVFMLYDMIPIVCPYVPDELRDMFRKYLPFVMKFADKVIVNSQSCKRDFEAYTLAHGYNPPPVAVIHLSHRLPKIQINSISPMHDLPLRTRKLASEKFALCVGSIESRKNHINLIISWTKFFNSDVYNNEKLVIVGKWLWDTDDLARALTNSGHINGSVIILSDASDAEIEFLYKNCRFTVYPSHYEGWGLPLGESLTAGKPCLHFDNSSLKEAGYGLTNAVPYPDYEKFNDELVRLMTEDDYYFEVVDIINSNQRLLRSWSDFSFDIHNFFVNINGGITCD